MRRERRRPGAQEKEGQAEQVHGEEHLVGRVGVHVQVTVHPERFFLQASQRGNGQGAAGAQERPRHHRRRPPLLLFAAGAVVVLGGQHADDHPDRDRDDARNLDGGVPPPEHPEPQEHGEHQVRVLDDEEMSKGHAALHALVARPRRQEHEEHEGQVVRGGYARTEEVRTGAGTLLEARRDVLQESDQLSASGAEVVQFLEGEVGEGRRCDDAEEKKGGGRTSHCGRHGGLRRRRRLFALVSFARFDLALGNAPRSRLPVRRLVDLVQRFQQELARPSHFGLVQQLRWDAMPPQRTWRRRGRRPAVAAGAPSIRRILDVVPGRPPPVQRGTAGAGVQLRTPGDVEEDVGLGEQGEAGGGRTVHILPGDPPPRRW
mmetsp:Transcript_5011/g.14384  ORF Transcript_5011/g.14384 Transcript_5011/m.14384 type:complete len:374 (-) Transcript_5011:118-1239(-)